MNRNIRQKLTAAVALAAIILCAICAPSLFPVGAAKTNSKIDSLNNKLAQLDKEKKALSSNINSAKNQKSEELAKKDRLDGEIDNLEQQVDTINDLISELNSQISDNDKKVADLENQIDGKYDVFKKRMRSSYEQGPISILSVFFSSADFSKMLTQMDVVNEILNYDNQLITSLEQGKAELKNTKNELSENKAQQQGMKNQLKDKENSLQSKKAESDRTIAGINANVDKFQADYKKIAAEEDRLEAEIAKQLKELNKPSNVYVGGEFVWPLPSQYTNIISAFGYRFHPVLHVNKLHSGCDIVAPGGTPIYAANAGKVVTSTMSAAWGNYVVIDHGGGKATLYAHMSSRGVSVGQTVKQGQTIGRVGSTGWSTGNHLHFEMRINGTPVNAMNYYSKG